VQGKYIYTDKKQWTQDTGNSGYKTQETVDTRHRKQWIQDTRNSGHKSQETVDTRHRKQWILDPGELLSNPTT
jgi:hypothetical protein